MKTSWWRWVPCAVALLTACGDSAPSGNTPPPDASPDVTGDQGGGDVPGDQGGGDVTGDQGGGDVPGDAGGDDVTGDTGGGDVPGDTGGGDVPGDTGGDDVPGDTGGDDAAVDAADAAPDSPCLMGQMQCSGTCVDTQSDLANCGMCGNACPTGSTCSMGRCACPMGQASCGAGAMAACVDTQSSNAHCGRCDNACPTGQTCTAGACVAECAAPRTRCGMGATATCVDTQTDAANCGSCGNACPMGQVCTAGRCGCAMGRLSCMGTCVDGNSDNMNCGDCGNACVGGSTCQMGRCACAAGQQLCGMGTAAMCVDTQSSNANCGACGNACGAGQTCRMGRCECPAGQTVCGSGMTATCVDLQTSNANCGTCSTACEMGLTCRMGRCECPTGETRCGSACVNTMTSNANCGACGRACGMAQTCAGGACTCPSGQTACGTACVDARADNNNCGRCGNVCSGGQTCQAGVCTCPAGQMLCGSSCVDVRADNANCGRCGNACMTGLTCQAGACNCPTGLTLCGSACVDTRTDRANCGRCGNMCSATTSCSAGTCAAGAPPNDNRTGAIDINMASSSTSLLVNTTAANNSTRGACGCTSGNDVFYRFVLTQQELVYADTTGASWDASLFLQDAMGVNLTDPRLPGGAVCNDDGGTAGCPIGTQAQIAALLPAGTYFLVLSGCGAGEVSVRFQHLPAGTVVNRINAANGVTFTSSSTLTGASTSSGACCSNGADATWYAITCPTSAALPAAAFASANGLTNLTLEQRSAGRAPVASCASNSSCGGNTSLSTTLPAGAGLHTFVVDSCGAGGGPYAVAISFGVCPSGTTQCNGACVNVTSDDVHCGRCGNACTGGQVCTSGSCACRPGTSLCGGACIPTLADVNNCGACGNRCGFSQTCVAGACRTLPVGPSFRVGSLTGSNCRAIEHNTVTGDDRGGIAVSNAQVFYSGDTATGRFALADLSGGTRVGRTYDGLVSNLRTGRVYTLASNATTPIGTSGGVVTHLIEVDGNTGALLTTSVITLSTPISVPVGTGIFSGYDRAGLHSGARFYHIQLPSGVVTDMGGMPNPARAGCESWAYWGVLEFFGGTLYIDYVANPTTIARMSVPGGTVSTLATFAGLSDMCTFTVQPRLNRWYWHHEGNSQFRNGDESIGFCDATWSSPDESFRINTLANTGCSTLEHASVTGDDRGGIAVSPTQVFYTGDLATGRFNASDLSSPTRLTTTPTQVDAFAQNLRNGAIYAFGGTSGLLSFGGGTATQLLELDGATGALTGRSIPLSLPISMGSNTGIFSGWNRIVVLAGGRAWDIALPTGSVVDLGAVAVPSHTNCESWAFWGTAESFGGTLYVNYVASASQINRMSVPAGGVTTLATFPTATFTGLSDMCSFSFSPARNRWYWHHEGSSTLRGSSTCGSDEALGFCGASYSNP